ncbi:NAD dependent epimerase dehydratase family [Apiospora phragmitis]|uniref:NAD dependent epimerase dehydratase family n=1 Tax=Apiospora phragmitis TaxID=2905665 RepID=A0ABR1SUI9_9PEZI
MKMQQISPVEARDKSYQEDTYQARETSKPRGVLSVPATFAPFAGCVSAQDPSLARTGLGSTTSLGASGGPDRRGGPGNGGVGPRCTWRIWPRSTGSCSRRCWSATDEKLPTGKRGILFSGNGRQTWRKGTQGVTDACYAAGRIQDNIVKSVGLEEGAAAFSEYLGVDGPNAVELGYCGDPRIVSSVARSLGWKLMKGYKEARRQGFSDGDDSFLG